MTDRNHNDGRATLPPELQRAAAELRRIELSDEFDMRLADALVAADQHGPSSHARPSLWTRAGGPWIALVPGAAAMALMLHVTIGGEATDEELWHQPQMQELELVLDDVGHSWVDLALLTHHHDGHQATVKVDAPHDVRVMVPDHALHANDSPVCAAERCVHKYSQPTHDADAAALQVGVAEPGRYRISVEHASNGSRVREEFVVHARR